MPKGILGKKLGMTEVFDADGRVTPVTVIEAGPCTVVQRKTTENDGYEAIQLGFGEKRENLFNRPLKGHFKRANVKPTRYLRELRVESGSEYEAGQKITVEIFSAGDVVDVTGTSKGKGFAGVVKRYGFNRGPMSHGSMYHRRVGSLGATDPQRVFKGRRMPGRLGGDRVTVQGLEVVRVDADRNLLLVKGSVPGPKGSLVIVKESVKPRKAK